MPPGLTATAICIPCEAGHLTVGCTWDKEFAAEFLAKLRKQKRFDVAAVAAAGHHCSKHMQRPKRHTKDAQGKPTDSDIT